MAITLLCVVCLGCACAEARDRVKLSYWKNVYSQHWHNNPVYPCALWYKGEAPYYSGETAHWLRKCQGKITVKFFDALEWTIITALSRKVAQLTEINSWGIVVVKNTPSDDFLQKFLLRGNFKHIKCWAKTALQVKLSCVIEFWKKEQFMLLEHLETIQAEIIND